MEKCILHLIVKSNMPTITTNTATHQTHVFIFSSMIISEIRCIPTIIENPHINRQIAWIVSKMIFKIIYRITLSSVLCYLPSQKIYSYQLLSLLIWFFRIQKEPTNTIDPLFCQCMLCCFGTNSVFRNKMFCCLPNSHFIKFCFVTDTIRINSFFSTEFRKRII